MNTADPHNDVTSVVDHLFRHEAGRMVSTLTRIFGVDNMDLAEDVMQEALLKALKQWPFTGIPKNPAGWIMQVAKNHALDVVRREASFNQKQEAIVDFLEQKQEGSKEMDELFFDDEIADDQLRMMFTCCHPSIPEEAQVALTLKTLCGFSTGEIARAFLSKEETIAKRLMRAKQKLRDEVVQFEIPAGEQLSKRLRSIHQVLYLLFNEGYNASHGDDLIRYDLCEDALRLTRLLVEHNSGHNPATRALLALMLLHAARMPARVNDAGATILLHEQNRLLWDRHLMIEGLSYLNESSEGDEISQFHLEAGIAACHLLAESYETTDWGRILEMYNMLMVMNPSPIVALNRAVAISFHEGAEAGLEALELIRDKKILESYYLFHAVKADFYFRLNCFNDALVSYQQSLSLTGNKSEQTFLKWKVELCLMQMKN